ncbi:MAG TPA: hypothetical protein VJG49_04215 [Candidatus Nanoarchaeia archaeon]|nr:hypothetical protein [Candidatus Nanoarchaeia archaeon]
MDEEVVLALYEEALKVRKKSNCNILKVGAALLLPDGWYYVSSNGHSQQSCAEKGPDYCTRDPHFEYLTCPSSCAEGNAILTAAKDGRNTEGSTIISTIFPCDRCVNLAIDYGIAEVCFGEFKENPARPSRLYYTKLMEHFGISAFKINEIGRERRVLPFSSGLDDLWMGCIPHRTGAEYYVRLLCDPEFRAQELEKCQRRLQELEQPDPLPPSFEGLTVKPLT